MLEVEDGHWDAPLQAELWGGVECTINRVGERFFEQVQRSGHTRRFDDFTRFAGLGIKTLRHGVNWEWVASRGWSWPDEALREIGLCGMDVVAGLLHHGSGPRFTSLLDPAFPQKLAGYAAAVARRYPWLEAYTPVNEPLTTARFSGLYGLWYPHARDDRSFARALLQQMKGTVLAMQAIRKVNPAARLVQTEDVGRTWSTEPIAYQAEFDNQRRWLPFDLLCGTVDAHHPMVSYLRHAGLSDAEIFWFADHPCPPEMLGLNYYITSDRFLDHRVEIYPPPLAGGNGRDAYADVEAVRVMSGPIPGVDALLAETWERFALPVAITEVHNGCEVEQQIAWFTEQWERANRLRRRGVPVQAVTAWALLGSYDWDCLVTEERGCYEPGVFAVRPSGEVEPTALADTVARAAAGLRLEPAVTGWWRRPERLLYAEHDEPSLAAGDLAA